MRSAFRGRSAWRVRLLKGNYAAGFVLTVVAALAGCQREPSADTQGGERVQQIRARGYLNCGVRGDVAGFSARDANGKYSGLEADMCRALAGALLGNVEAVRFHTIAAIADFTQNRDLDVVFHGLTWTYSRALTSGLSFSPVVFHDGQAFLAPKNRGVAAAADLSDRSICVTTGSAAARYLQRYFQARNLTLRALVVESEEEAFSLLSDGQCDAMSADASHLASLLLTHPERASGFFVLPERISKEPLAGVTRRGDAALHDALTWAVYALVQAEEFGLTQANVDQVQAGERPDKDEFLQLAAESSEPTPRWIAHTIKQLGNYGEIYDRHLGGATAAQLPRGQNALWTEGGLMYSPPFSTR